MKTSNTPASPTINVVEFDSTEHKFGGYGLHGWQYVTAMIQLHPNGPTSASYIDTGCTMNTIGRELLHQQLPDITIQPKMSPIIVGGVAQGTHHCNKYARLDICLQRPLIASIHRDEHIVDGMKVKLLIGIDVIGPKRIVLDMPQ